MHPSFDLSRFCVHSSPSCHLHARSITGFSRMYNNQQFYGLYVNSACSVEHYSWYWAHKQQ
jgi:hypothetical protein